MTVLCQRCGYEWTPWRDDVLPKSCPACTSKAFACPPAIALPVTTISFEVMALAVHEASEHVDGPKLLGRSRNRAITRWRRVAVHLLRRDGWTLQRLGDQFGGRDHTTIMHYTERADRWILDDSEFRRDVAAVNAALANGVE